MYEHWEPLVPEVEAPHSLAATVKAPVLMLPYWLHWEGPRLSSRVVEGDVGSADVSGNRDVKIRSARQCIAVADMGLPSGGR